jgi:Erv1 / Alr family
MKRQVISSLIWGPKIWFIMHCAAYNYPDYPNPITKRKYYDFIQNIPLFIPDAEMGDTFSVLLDKYPVSPYLCSRESFMRWVHFVHNKINCMLGKDEISLYASLDKFHQENVCDMMTQNYYCNLSNKSIKRFVFTTIILISLWFICIQI